MDKRVPIKLMQTGGAVLITIAAIVVILGVAALRGRPPLGSELILPILFVAYRAGRDAGLFATATAMVAALLIFDPSPSVVPLFERIAVIGVIGLVVSVLTGRLHEARRRAESAAQTCARASEALLASEERFGKAFASNPAASAILRMSDWQLIDANSAYLELLGYDRSQIVGRTADELDFYADPADRAATRARLLSDGAIRNQELQIKTRTGEVRDVRWSLEVIELAGAPHMLATINDITHGKAAAAALVHSEERLREIAETIREVFWLVDPVTRQLLYVSSAYEAIWGRSCASLYAAPGDWFEAIHPEDRQRVFASALTKQAEGTYNEQYRIVRPDGSVRWIHDRAFPVRDANGVMIRVAGAAEDITDAKRAADELHESESKFRQIAEAMTDVFFVLDPRTGKTLYISPAYEVVWGRTCLSLYETPSTWLDAVHPADRARMSEDSTRDSKAQSYSEFRIIRPDGAIRWIHGNTSLVRDEAGVPVRIVGIASDVTDRRGLEDQLRQSQKLESLGMLAGGIAHDFNNLLAVISSCGSLLSESIPAASPDRELVDDIEGAVDRAVGLTRQLLAFSRKQVVEPVVLDLNQIVNDTRKMLRRMLGEDVIVTTSLEPELHHVRIDPGYLVQVLMNLAVNARDAMPRGGNLTLATRNEGDRVVLSVTDTGCGMPPEVRERIFEPFFTTKERGKGTGMGLAVVHGIVDQAGGRLELDTEVGVGTTFRVVLASVSDAIDTKAASTVIAHGTETILLVDDDDYVRRAAARGLRSRGYKVLEAGDGAHALAVIDESRDIDMLLTDVVMPGMDGRQLADAARLKLPALRILYTSGYTDDAVVRHGVQQGDVQLIEKPYRVVELAGKVRQVLDADLHGASDPALLRAS